MVILGGMSCCEKAPTEEEQEGEYIACNEEGLDSDNLDLFIDIRLHRNGEPILISGLKIEAYRRTAGLFFKEYGEIWPTIHRSRWNNSFGVVYPLPKGNKPVTMILYVAINGGMKNRLALTTQGGCANFLKERVVLNEGVVIWEIPDRIESPVLLELKENGEFVYK